MQDPLHVKNMHFNMSPTNLSLPFVLHLSDPVQVVLQPVLLYAHGVRGGCAAPDELAQGDGGGGGGAAQEGGEDEEGGGDLQCGREHLWSVLEEEQYLLR